MATESKDQKRARLNREGKAMIKEGRHSDITPQHQTAMDYFFRKDRGKNIRRTLVSEEGAGTVGSKATGTAASTNVAAVEATKGFERNRGKDDRAYRKIGILARDVAASRGPKSEFRDVGTRKLNPRSAPYALNYNDEHPDSTPEHASMATIGELLSNKLDDAHDSGKLLSHHTINIDNALTAGHDAFMNSAIAHEKGLIGQAKHYMEAARGHFHSATVQMRAKGIDLHPGIEGALKTISERYTGSSVPGQGAMPHENWKMPPSQPQKPLEERTAKKPEEKSLNSLSKNIEAEYKLNRKHGNTSEDFESTLEPEYTSENAMSQQLKSQGYGAHFNV